MAAWHGPLGLCPCLDTGSHPRAHATLVKVTSPRFSLDPPRATAGGDSGSP